MTKTPYIPFGSDEDEDWDANIPIDWLDTIYNSKTHYMKIIEKGLYIKDD